MMTRDKDAILAATNEAWENLEFDVALDSGSVVHVCAPADCRYRNHQAVDEARSS